MKFKLPTIPIAMIAVMAVLAMTFAPALVSDGFAHKGASGVVKKRMDQMKEMKGQLKEIEQMVKGKKPYNNKSVHKALDYIRDHAGGKMSKLFPKGTAHKPSEADPAIWKNWQDFEKLAVSLNHSTDDFRAKLPKAPDDTALKSLRKDALKIRRVCKACHDRFRL